MDFMFVLCLLWFVFSLIRNRNIFIFSCIISCLLFTSFLCRASDDSEPVNQDFLLKSHKVIEAVPNVLRRSHSSTAFDISKDWDCSSVGACDDKMGYDAIRILHRQLDDDANGSIDVAESDEFLRDELQYENGYERHKGFHGNDKYINVDELWQAWKISEVHNWTTDETVEWLINYVDLPQYEHNFRNNGVNGTCLPRLAINAMNYLSLILGIKDAIHKQKIALKAMDVVLFGPPKHHNYLKDVLLAVSLIIATGGCWFAYVQHKHSQTHMQKMMKDMDALQKAEDALLDLQKELNKAKQQQEIVSIEKQDLERRLQDEISTAKHYHVQPSTEGGDANEQVRIQELEKQLQIALGDLREAEKKLEARQWVPPPALQHWLQLSHELELRNYNAKKTIAEQQLQAAKEGCEKLSRKRATFMGAFRIAHGSSIDDVDDRIVKAKAALYEVTSDLQERMHRWKQIELLCGFPIIHNAGIAYLETILKPNLVNGSSSSIHSGLNTLTQSSSDTTLREESPPPYAGVIPCNISNIPPPPSYSKSSPSFIRKTTNNDTPAYNTIASTSRVVVYPRECYHPIDNLSSFEVENDDVQITEVDDDSTERSITPPSMASCPETSRPHFSLADGSAIEIPQQKSKDAESVMSAHVIGDHSNDKVGDMVRKISTGLMDKKKKPISQAVEALKKSASSSNIIEINEGGSSESSSSCIEEKHKKKKFFPQLRHRKTKMN